ncbi:MAG: DUF1778 domain-containing protein [Candidatus Electrothrix sp. Rat3]|nr:DUF1778 domain-containing protein [Candidatus Electrothrix rattekaaiensis]
MITARLDMRLHKDIKAKAEKASALLGMKSLTEYIVQLINDDATRVIAQHESMTVENDIFDRFMDSCERAEKPNKKLVEALAFTRAQEGK